MLAVVSRRSVAQDFGLFGQATRRELVVFSSLLVILMLALPEVRAETSDRQALAVIFGDEPMANVLELRRQAARESGERRYKLLVNAVLPPRTDLIRVDVDFSPTHPAPWVASQLDFHASNERGISLDTSALFPRGPRDSREPLGGELIAPAIEQKVAEAANASATFDASNIVLAAAALRHEEMAGVSEENIARPPRLNNWIAANAVTAQSNAAGYPGSHWRWDGSQLQNLSSHRQSLLFYRTPLRGNFEVSCELPADSWDEIQLMYAGEYVVPREDFVACRVGGVRLERSEPMDPPMAEPVGPPWFRIQVRNNVCTTWFNGRLVRRRTLAEDNDPWLAVQATSSRLHPAIRNLRIDGMPVVPGEVNLCADETLAGWSSYLEEEEEIGPGEVWEPMNDGAGKGLRATLQADYRGAHKESLLCYYRPMGDDDSLEYDFFYEPGASHVHPTLDGIAFLMQLESLHLTGTAVDDTAGTAISCLPELKTLGLSNTQVGDAVVRELPKLSKLEVLGLNNTTVHRCIGRELLTDDFTAQARS